MADNAERLPGLDTLRAAAIAAVMVHHAALFGLVSYEHWLVRFGWMGVDLFFGLSGFLIAGRLFSALAQGRKPNYVDFYVRRLFRTLPAYLVTVAFCFSFEHLRERPYMQPLWKFVTFTLNIGLPTAPPTALSHAWSLCVEEHFYLAFPFLVFVLASRPSFRTIAGIFLSIALAGLLIRGYVWLAIVAEHPYAVTSSPNPDRFLTWIYYPTWTRLDGLSAGVAVAALRAFRPKLWDLLTRKPDLLLIVGAFAVLSSCVLFRQQIGGFAASTLGFPLLAIGVALVVAAGSTERSVIGRCRIPGAGSTAAISYSLYLTHKIIFHLVQLQMQDWPSWLQTIAPVIAALAAIATGSALFWLVERPFLRLRDRLRPSRRLLALDARSRIPI